MHKPCGSPPAASQRLLIFLCVQHFLWLPLLGDVVELNHRSRSQVKLIKLLECFSNTFLSITEIAENVSGEPGDGNGVRCSLIVFIFVPEWSQRELIFHVNCSVFVLEKARRSTPKTALYIRVEGRKACDSLTSGAESYVKSCRAGCIAFSGTWGNLFVKLGLKPSGSLKMRPEAHVKFVLSTETPKAPLEIGPLLRGKLSKRVKYGIKVLAVVCVAEETQLAALRYLAFSKDVALCLAILFCVVLMGSCRETSHRSQIPVLWERLLDLAQSEMDKSIPGEFSFH